MYIPDPEELMEAQMEQLEDQVINGKIACSCCGEMHPVEDMVASGPSPTSPPICQNCLSEFITR